MKRQTIAIGTVGGAILGGIIGNNVGTDWNSVSRRLNMQFPNFG